MARGGAGASATGDRAPGHAGASCGPEVISRCRLDWQMVSTACLPCGASTSSRCVLLTPTFRCDSNAARPPPGDWLRLLTERALVRPKRPQAAAAIGRALVLGDCVRAARTKWLIASAKSGSGAPPGRFGFARRSWRSRSPGRFLSPCGRAIGSFRVGSAVLDLRGTRGGAAAVSRPLSADGRDWCCCVPCRRAQADPAQRLERGDRSDGAWSRHRSSSSWASSSPRLLPWDC